MTAADFYRGVKADYAADPLAASGPGDARVAELLRIVNDELDAVDRTIIILYAETGSLREVGKMLGLSHMTVRKEIMRIRAEILTRYEHSVIH